jgi:hypothetical protein
MRRRVLIAGLIVLVIGASLYFLGPYLARGSLNIDQLVQLRNASELEPGSTIALGNAPPGMAFAVVYNSTPPSPMKVIAAGAEVNEERSNGTFIAIYYNEGSSSASVALLNNNTYPVTAYYSAAPLSIYGVLYSMLSVLLGGLLIVAGGITVVVGLILRPKLK